MSDDIDFAIDASKAERGARQFEKAITQIELAVKRLDTAATSALSKIKSPNTEGFRKAAKDLQSLSNIRLNPNLAANLNDISTSLNSFRAPGKKQVANVRELMRVLGSANINRSVGTALASLSGGMAGFKAPAKSQVKAMGMLLRSLESVDIDPSVGRALAGVKDGLAGFKGVSGAQAKNVREMLLALQGVKVSPSLGRSIGALTQGFTGFKAPSASQIDRLERFVTVMGRIKVPSNGGALAAYISSINKASAGLNMQVARMGSGMRSIPFAQAGSGAKGLTGNLRGLENAFSTSYQAGSQLRILLGSLTVGEFTRQIFIAGNEAASFKSTMEIATDSIEEMQKQLEFTRRVAERFGVDMGVIMREFGKFSASVKLAGGTAEQTNYIFERMSAAMRVMKASPEDQAGVMRAMTQIFSKGKVMAEELQLQIGDRLPGAFGLMQDALRKATGDATLNLSKLLQEGRVGADAMIIFAEAVGEKFGKGVASASIRADAEIARLTNSWREFRTIVADSGALDGIALGAKTISNSLKSLNAGGEAQKFGETINRMASAASRGVVLIIENFDMIKKSIAALVAFFVARSFGSLIATAAGTAMTSLKGLTAGATAATTTMKGFWLALGGPLVMALKLGAAALAFFWHEQVKVGETSASVGEVVKASASVMWEGIKAGVGGSISYLGELGSAYLGSTGDAGSWAKQSVEWIKWMANEAFRWLKLIGRTVYGYWKGVISTTKAGFDALASGDFSGVMSAMSSAASDAWKDTTTDLKKIWSEDSDVFKTFGDSFNAGRKLIEDEINKARKREANLALQQQIEREQRLKEMNDNPFISTTDTSGLNLILDKKGGDAAGSLSTTGKAAKDAADALEEYEQEVRTLSSALSAGKITQDQYNQSLSFAKDKLQETTAPFQAMLKAMREEKKLLGLSGRTQRVEEEYRERINTLLEKGIALTDGQKASLRGLINEMDRIKNPTGINAYVAGIEDLETAMGKIEEQAIGGMADAFADFVVTGKADIKSLSQTILREFIKLFTNQIIKWLMTGENPFGRGGVVGQTTMSTLGGAAAAASSVANDNTPLRGSIDANPRAMNAGDLRGTIDPMELFSKPGVSGALRGSISPGGDIIGGAGALAMSGKTISLSARDLDLIGRVVDTEVVKSLSPANRKAQSDAVTDTILNRVASDQFPNTVEGVLNEHRAFSKITGPQRLNPYGSVENAPAASRKTQNLVNQRVAARAGGAPSLVGGDVNYLNPLYSDQANLNAWGNDVVAQAKAKGQVFGGGRAKHYHGTAKGKRAADPYNVSAPSLTGGVSDLSGATPVQSMSFETSGIQDRINSAFDATMPQVADNFRTQMQMPTQDLATDLRGSLDPLKNSGQDFTGSLKPANDQVAQDYTMKMKQANSQVASSVGGATSSASSGLQTFSQDVANVGQQASSASGGLGGFLGNFMSFVQQLMGIGGSLMGGGGGGGGIGGILSGVMGLFGGFSEGGYSNSPVSRHSAALSAFAGAKHYAEGTANTSGIPAILHDNEAVIPLSRGRKIPVEMNGVGSTAAQGGANGMGGGGSIINFNITSPDADSFRRSESQIKTRIASGHQRAASRNS